MIVVALHREPLQTVWDALERAGCQPRGPLHQFVALCPAHEDHEPSLSVGIGADARALIHCHRGCVTELVLDLIDLMWSDLFPAGHRHARPIPGLAKPTRFADLVLQALREVGIPYRATQNPGMWVAESCPGCRRSDGWPLWIVEDDRSRVTLSCAGGCDQVDVLGALVGEEAS